MCRAVAHMFTCGKDKQTENIDLPTKKICSIFRKSVVKAKSFIAEDVTCK